MARLRLAILISGRGSNMQSLLAACRSGTVAADPCLVLSNRAEAAGLTLAEAAGVPTRVVPHRAFGERAAFDAAIDDALCEARIEFVCLAGFMRLLTRSFIETWRDKMLNIHPSLLPAFPGLDTHRRALAAGVKFSGCTVHFVRFETDTGPIIAQAAVPVLASDDEARLAARVLEAEHRLYPLALGLVAAGKVQVEGERVVLEGTPPPVQMILNPAG
jgi:phosphoribosylglycinamide formyltransferase 1